MVSLFSPMNMPRLGWTREVFFGQTEATVFLSLVTQLQVQTQFRANVTVLQRLGASIYTFLSQVRPGSCTSHFCSHPIGQHYVTWLPQLIRKPGKCSLQVSCLLLAWKDKVLQDSSPSRLYLLVHKLFPTRKWNLYS